MATAATSPTNDAPENGAYLADQRHRLGLTRERLAFVARVHPHTIAQAERSGFIGPSAARRLARALGVDVSRLSRRTK